MAVSRAGLVLHLSGHHGDATPGSTVFVRMKGIRAYQRELKAKNYANMKPGIEDEPWGLVMTVIDPFGNHIRFCRVASGVVAARMPTSNSLSRKGEKEQAILKIGDQAAKINAPVQSRAEMKA